MEDEIEAGNVFLINKHTNQEWRKLQSDYVLKHIDAAWAFGSIACYAIYRDRVTDKITKYGMCDNKRIKCDLCDTWWSCHTSNAFMNHLANGHLTDAKGFAEPQKALFCKACGIEESQLKDDPEHIIQLNDLRSQIMQFNEDFQPYLNWNRNPKPLSAAGAEVEKYVHDATIELMVGLNSTPNSISKQRVLTRFISVCYLLYLCASVQYKYPFLIQFNC